ncbi:MAG: hypothetical protein V2J51_03000 [Erythrobacter sp.]|jgi:hypothetical protein|nr:hypothetical protein [Erythrobacter sp.]
MGDRPDGSQATTFGWLLIIVGLIAAYMGAEADTIEGTIWGAITANLGLGLGMILVSLGYLVRAIWFLPGRGDQETELEKAPYIAPEQASFHHCDWCHLKVQHPAIACSQKDDEQIYSDLLSLDEEAVLEEACELELKRRGYLQE